MDYQTVWEFVSDNFERFPPEYKKFENSLKLPGVLFSISLIIYNQLLDFCKDCHSAFLKGNAELKRKIIKIVCSNFSYDGSNIVIEPNPIFKAVIKNSLSNKKLTLLDDFRTFLLKLVA